MPGTVLAVLQRRFAEFAATYPELRLYAAVSREVAADPSTAALLQSAATGQDRPVLWFAALHDLVLRDPTVPAARWYASVVGRDGVPDGDPWPDVRTTVLAHADELRATIATRTTQTNEVNRCVYLVPALGLACADRPGEPVALVEMGASAGLLLHLDRYSVSLDRPNGPAELADAASPVRCRGTDRSTVPYASRDLPELPPVVGRAGLDLHPVDLIDRTDGSPVRWLEACLWPDVPGRVERFRTAVELVRSTPNPVRCGDMAGDLPAAVFAATAAAPAGGHVVVFSSWSLTYLDRSRSAEVPATLADLARDGRAVTWLTAEPPGCVPGIPAGEGAEADDGQTTVLGVRRWRDGVERPATRLGTAHPHGAWVRLD